MDRPELDAASPSGQFLGFAGLVLVVLAGARIASRPCQPRAVWATVRPSMSTERPTPPLPRADLVVDASGLLCPMPIVKLAQAVKGVAVGKIVEVVSTDPGILADAPAWARSTGHEIVGGYSEGNRHRFWFRKLHA